MKRRTDVARLLLEAAAKLSQGSPHDWGTAMRAELASIADPTERRRFALGAAVALLGTPDRRRSGLLAVATAAAFAAVLLAFSRATVGEGGLGALSVLGPVPILFAIGFFRARARSLRFGFESGVLAALAMLAGVAAIYGIEAPRWYEAAHVYVLDGDYAKIDDAGAAVRDALNPVILAAHLLWWLPSALLGANLGDRTRS